MKYKHILLVLIVFFYFLNTCIISFYNFWMSCCHRRKEVFGESREGTDERGMEMSTKGGEKIFDISEERAIKSLLGRRRFNGERGKREGERRIEEIWHIWGKSDKIGKKEKEIYWRGRQREREGRGGEGERKSFLFFLTPGERKFKRRLNDNFIYPSDILAHN